MKNYAEHARVTAICVNLALDAVEADIRSAMDTAEPQAAELLDKVLSQLNRHRVAETAAPDVRFVM